MTTFQHQPHHGDKQVIRSTQETNISILVNAAQNAAQAQYELSDAGRRADRETRKTARARLEENLLHWGSDPTPEGRQQEHAARVALSIFDMTVAQ